MKPIFTLCIVPFLAISTPCLAQQPSTAPPYATIDPLRIAAARQMLEASRVVRNARIGAAIAAEAGFNARLEKSEIANDEELASAIRKTLFDELSRILDEMAPRLVEETAISYASQMSIQDLNEATAFYLSPAGQKLLDITPAMASESSGKMQEWIKPYLPKVEEAVAATVRDILAKRARPNSEH